MPPWFLWTLSALLSWGLWAVLSKIIGDALSGPHSQALSTLGSVPVIIALAVALARRKEEHYSRRGIGLALFSGLVSGLGNISYYQALSSGAKAATVIPLTALYPVVTIALAALFLAEKLNPVQMMGVGISLAAIYLFNISEEKGLFSKALHYAVLPLLLWGAAGFLQKLTTNHTSGELSALCFLVAFAPLAVLILLKEPLAVTAISPRTWILVLGLGFFLSLGNAAVLVAFARGGKASIIAPMAGLYPAIGVPIAIAFLSEKVGPREITGILLALISVAAMSMETPSIVSPTTQEPSTFKG